VLRDIPAALTLAGEMGQSEIVPFVSAWSRYRTSEGQSTILSVLNPHDRRKDLRTLLLGFREFCRTSSRPPLLVVKLIIDNVDYRLSDVPEMLANVLRMPATDISNVILISERLSEDTLARLYASCDFYLTASRCEGQNLPLIEAMQLGCLAISPDHTAMAEYVSAENAIVIPTARKRADPESNAFGSKDLFWHQADPADVGRCVETAVGLSRDRRIHMAETGRRRTVDLFSSDAVGSQVMNRLQDHL